jgi:hypothetical protein
VLLLLLLLLFIIYIVNLPVVRPRSCRVIYYFNTPALGRRHQFFDRVNDTIESGLMIEMSKTLGYKIVRFSMPKFRSYKEYYDIIWYKMNVSKEYDSVVGLD